MAAKKKTAKRRIRKSPARKTARKAAPKRRAKSTSMRNINRRVDRKIRRIERTSAAYVKKALAVLTSGGKKKATKRRKARKNPTARTTKAGRVLRGSGSVRASAKLLAARLKAEQQHKRKPRRAGKRLTFQSAQYILNHAKGAKRRGGSRKSTGGGKKSGSPLSGAFDFGLNKLKGVTDIRI